LKLENFIENSMPIDFTSSLQKIGIELSIQF
jgi:hypothetical protein